MKHTLIVIIANFILTIPAVGQTAFVRINQAGYLPYDQKVAIVFSTKRQTGKFAVINTLSKAKVYTGDIVQADRPHWGSAFPFYHTLDLSALKLPGRYFIALEGSDTVSREFTIGAYPSYHEDLLFFMRQQRCGYNPFLDMACHRRDGRSFYAPFPDETFVDASGGWHDAGDQLKYLITASNATARMMLAYELQKPKFGDFVDDLGRKGRPNGIPDILDEAKWGLEWIHKLHPNADQLFHQVADDRDHRGFKMPNNDNADYGWGPNSYRPVYFADGKPQGLSQYKSRSTGVANIAGRSAAAMAMGYRIWKNDLKESEFAAKVPACGRNAVCNGQTPGRFSTGQFFRCPLSL